MSRRRWLIPGLLVIVFALAVVAIEGTRWVDGQDALGWEGFRGKVEGVVSERGVASGQMSLDRRPRSVEWRQLPSGEGWREVWPAGGRAVHLPRRPERLVSQTLATDEILLALSSTKRIVALSRFAHDPSYTRSATAALALPTFEGGGAEGLLGLRPDLVFLANYSEPEKVYQIRAAGIPVLQLERHDSIAAIEENIRVVGLAIGEEGKAEALIDEMEERLETIVDRVPQRRRSKPRVLGYSRGWVPGTATTFDDVVRRLGGTNVATEAGITGWAKVGLETLSQWQPEILLVEAEPDREQEWVSDLMAQPVLAATPAAREGRVVAVPSPVFGTVSHHVVELVATVAEALYPDTGEQWE